MALIHCPECGGTLSDQAVGCPHCGFPYQAAKRSSSAQTRASGEVKEWDIYRPVFDPAGDRAAQVLISLFSLTIPGFAQILQGRPLAAVLQFLTALPLWIFVPPFGVLVHLFSCVEAMKFYHTLNREMEEEE